MLQLPRPASFQGLILLVAAYDLLLTGATTYILPWIATITTLPDSLWQWVWGSREAFNDRCLLCLSLNFALWLCDALESGSSFSWAMTHAQPRSLVFPASWTTMALLFLQVEYLTTTLSNILLTLPWLEPTTSTLLYQVVRAKELVLEFFLLYSYANAAIWIASKCCCDDHEVSEDLTAGIFECESVYGDESDPFELSVPGSFPVTKCYRFPKNTVSALARPFRTLVSGDDIRTGYSLPSPTTSGNWVTQWVFCLSPTDHVGHEVEGAHGTCQGEEDIEEEESEEDNDNFSRTCSSDDDRAGITSDERAEGEFEPEGVNADTDYDADTESTCDDCGREEEGNANDAQHDTNANVNKMQGLPEHAAFFRFNRIDHLGRRNAWDWTNLPTLAAERARRLRSVAERSFERGEMQRQGDESGDESEDE